MSGLRKRLLEAEFIAEIEDLKEWASSVERRLKNKVNISYKKHEIIDERIVIGTFDIKFYETVPSREMNDILLKIGMKYSRGRRYFWVYDRKSGYLMLQFYPFYKFTEGGDTFREDRID